MGVFVGTGRLTRLALRRDRIVLPVTFGLILAMVVGSIPALVATYPNYETQLAYVVASVPSIFGRIFQGTLQGPNLSSIIMAELFLFAAILIGVMSIFVVSRHTRHNEETGAGELIGSTVVSRSSPLSAALLVAIGVNLLLGFIIYLSLLSVPELGRTGSAFFAISLVLLGIFFAGVSAVTVQLSDYRRGANMMAISVLVGLFLVRGFGDAMGEVSADGLSVTAHWISWLSPLGWAYQVLPYTENRLTPLLMLLAITILAIGSSYFLMSKRDIGSSIFQSRSGRARAQASLLGGFGLARRLQRGGFLAWLIGFSISGLMVGFLVNDFRETFEENEVFQALIAQNSSDSLSKMIISSMFPLMAASLAGYAVTALSKMQDEEGSGRIELILSTALGRTKWLISHVWVITVGIASLFLSMGLVGAVSYLASATSEADVSFGEILLAAISSIPAMLLFAAVILVVFAFFGRFVKALAWTYYAYCALIASLVGIFSWPQWVSDFSPFTHTPIIPSDNPQLLPFFVMSALSVLLLGVSIMAFGRRDINLK